MVAAAVVSLAAWITLEALSPSPALVWTQEMLAAAERMREATSAVANHLERAGIPVDPTLDPNRTGLVGPEYTDLFTTLGQLEAKRTSTSPDMAALLVHLLRRAGVSSGDTIAVGASGSFPALLIATLVAAEAVGAHPVTILSLGASSYGATRPDFHLLDMHRALLDAGVVATPPAAVSLGGHRDVGDDFDPAFGARLATRIRDSGVPLIHEPDLRRNVSRRLAVYLGVAEPQTGSGSVPSSGAGRIRAFVNIGGSDANLGTSPRVLGLEPGLIGGPGEGTGSSGSAAVPPVEQRGVLYEMAARGVPVIHLLHVRGLSVRHGLPWDPIPLPEPGATALTRGPPGRGLPFWLITGTWLMALVLIAVATRGRPPRRSGRPGGLGHSGGPAIS